MSKECCFINLPNLCINQGELGNLGMKFLRDSRTQIRRRSRKDDDKNIYFYQQHAENERI